MQNNNRSLWASIMPVTKHLLIINLVVWLATIVLRQRGIVDLNDWLGLHFWKGSNFYVFQLLTYMFMHADFSHIFFNMFSLWMFGSMLERALGSKRYLFYYISCGLGAALVQEVVWQFSWQSILQSFVAGGDAMSVNDIINGINAGQANFTMDTFYNSLVTIGASGAVFGLLLAFGMIFPNIPLFLFFIPIPIKAKWMVIGYGIIELFFGVTHTMAGVAHYAHLGGMLAGIIMILYWKHKGTLMRGNGFY